MRKEDGRAVTTEARPHIVWWNVPRPAPITIGTALDIMYGG
jgi:hypothetical protein